MEGRLSDGQKKQTNRGGGRAREESAFSSYTSMFRNWKDSSLKRCWIKAIMQQKDLVPPKALSYRPGQQKGSGSPPSFLAIGQGSVPILD